MSVDAAPTPPQQLYQQTPEYPPQQQYQPPQQQYQQPQQQYQPPPQQYQPQQQQYPPQQQYQQQGYTPPVVPGAPTQDAIRDSQDNKTMAVLAYIIFFIPLLTGAHKTSPFVKFHTNQGTVLAIASAVYGIAYVILSTVLSFIPIIGWILIMIIGLVAILIPVLIIVGIINAVNGKLQQLPVIGGITIIK